MNLTKEDHEQIKIAVEALEKDVNSDWGMVGQAEKLVLLKYIEYLEGVVDELDITSSY